MGRMKWVDHFFLFLILFLSHSIVSMLWNSLENTTEMPIYFDAKKLKIDFFILILFQNKMLMCFNEKWRFR